MTTHETNSMISLQNSLPDDIALKIALSLQVFDVCSLGGCSRFWRELCGSDCVWEALCKDRWPAIVLDENSESQSHEIDQEMDSNLKRWRVLYISKHNEMAEKAALVTNFVERTFSHESVEVGNYLKAVDLLYSQKIGFKDVQIFLLKSNLNVLLNLVGLHYCIIGLGAPVEYVMKALVLNQISERQVCVKWWKLGRWFHGFRLRDELHSRNVSLRDLSQRTEVLDVLQRGAIHEVIRVQISEAKLAHTSWSFKVAQNVNI